MRARLLFLALAGLGLASPARANPFFPFRAQGVPIYEMRSPLNGDYLYTNNPAEMLSASATYQYVRVAFHASPVPGPATLPLYRFSRATGWATFVHAIGTEPAVGPRIGMNLEGLLGYASILPGPGLVPLYAYTNPQLGTYYFTTLPGGPPEAGYVFDTVMGYVCP